MPSCFYICGLWDDQDFVAALVLLYPLAAFALLTQEINKSKKFIFGHHYIFLFKLDKNTKAVPLFSILSLRNTSLITTSFQVQYSNKSLLCCPFTVLTVYRAVQQMKRRKVVGQILWWLKTLSTIHKGSEVPWVCFWVLKRALRKKNSLKKALNKLNPLFWALK